MKSERGVEGVRVMGSVFPLYVTLEGEMGKAEGELSDRTVRGGYK